MTLRLNKGGMRALAGAAVVIGPTAAACGSGGPTYEQWAETDGAAGRINLDAVQKAFEDAKSTTEFEKVVNEIYEGDGLVLIRAKQESDGLVLEGWEDLDNNSVIDDASDDQLFGIFERNNEHELRGYGTNSYYRSGFGAGNFLFTYMLLSSIGPRGYGYSTAPTYARTTMTSQRNHYRGTTAYRNQVGTNSAYFNRQKGFAGSQYSNAGRNISPGRQQYQAGQKSSGSYKTSRTGVRSSWGSSSRGASVGRSSGGFRGGGGGQRIIGDHRAFV